MKGRNTTPITRRKSVKAGDSVSIFSQESGGKSLCGTVKSVTKNRHGVVYIEVATMEKGAKDAD